MRTSSVPSACGRQNPVSRGPGPVTAPSSSSQVRESYDTNGPPSWANTTCWPNATGASAPGSTISPAPRHTPMSGSSPVHRGCRSGPSRRLAVSSGIGRSSKRGRLRRGASGAAFAAVGTVLPASMASSVTG